MKVVSVSKDFMIKIRCVINVYKNAYLVRMEKSVLIVKEVQKIEERAILVNVLKDFTISIYHPKKKTQNSNVFSAKKDFRNAYPKIQEFYVKEQKENLPKWAVFVLKDIMKMIRVKVV